MQPLRHLREPALSKKHGARKKRRRKSPPVACPQCHSPADASPGALLRAIGAALNAGDDAGLRVHVTHGAIFCADGVLLQAGRRWAMRSFQPGGTCPDPDDDMDS